MNYLKSARGWSLIILLVLAIAVKLVSMDPQLVENYYSQGLYPPISAFFRLLFGWVPFSIGDLIYLILAFWLLWKIVRFFTLIARRSLRRHLSTALLLKYVRIALAVYIGFSLFWGLNYFRQGVAQQVQLQKKNYSLDELRALVLVLHDRVNQYAALTEHADSSYYNNRSVLTDSLKMAFNSAANDYSFLKYKNPSIKPSLYSSVGHYFGFTGYFNPFTAEAQINMDVPVFLRPFIVAHEICHQLGYAKENEASFVGYLACTRSSNNYFKYSVYFDLYRSAAIELAAKDEQFVAGLNSRLHPKVVQDNVAVKLYLKKFKNGIEPLIAAFYDRYLKLNNQPAGKATYNFIIALLIDYMKEKGKAVI